METQTETTVVSLDTPENLAKLQWEACSDAPSVELVEITPAGEIIIKVADYSSPPADYLRCLATVAYQQVVDGKRNAQSLIRDIFFIDTRPTRSYLYKPSGHYPEAVELFASDQHAYLFVVISAPYAYPVNVSSVWTSPTGEVYRKEPRKLRSKGSNHRRWFVEQLVESDKSLGQWSVKLLIEGRDAGDYSFEVR